MTKAKSFINKYNWEGINYPSEKDGWEELETNNGIIVSNVLYAKKGKIYPAYVSKHNSNREKRGYSFIDSKLKRMALSCSKKTICIIKRNNIIM